LNFPNRLANMLAYWIVPQDSLAMSAVTQATLMPPAATLPRWLKFFSSWIVAGSIGWVDEVTGKEVSLFALYGIPIFMAVWYGSWRSGLLMAGACTMIWWFANRHDHDFTTWWGYPIATTSRCALFIMVAVGSAVMKSKQEVDRARIEALERTRELEQEIVRVSECEQRRIGQDLHDGLCQHLAAIGFAAKSLADDLEKSERPEMAAAQEIEQLIKNAVVEARDLARGMFPVQMDSAGLAAALEGLAATTSRLTTAEVIFTEKGEAHVANAAAAMHLYRIAQESVANAIKHGAARHVFITLDGTRDMLRLRVEDNGRGFFHDGALMSGMGLRTMAYRARLIGAKLEIQERDGPGTRVHCEMPLRVSAGQPVES
jgi:signal transduction histidine kinase